MTPAGTHLPVLKKIVSMTTGPVIEFGIGDNSTPVLHELCKDRVVVSLDNNLDWTNKYKHLQTEKHNIVYVANWDEAPISDGTLVFPVWSVALIDHAPVERRVVDIERIRQLAQYIVVHDTECPIYNYEPVLTSFKYRLDYTGQCPHTTIVSDYSPIPTCVCVMLSGSTNL